MEDWRKDLASGSRVEICREGTWLPAQVVRRTCQNGLTWLQLDVAKGGTRRRCSVELHNASLRLVGDIVPGRLAAPTQKVQEITKKHVPLPPALPVSGDAKPKHGVVLKQSIAPVEGPPQREIKRPPLPLTPKSKTAVAGAAAPVLFSPSPLRSALRPGLGSPRGSGHSRRVRVRETPVLPPTLPPSSPAPVSSRRRATILSAVEDNHPRLLEQDERQGARRRVDSAPPALLHVRQRRRSSLRASLPGDASLQSDAAAGGEGWPHFLSRAAARVAAAGLREEPAVLFEAFRVSDDLGLVYAAFARLFHLATAPASKGGRRRTVGIVAPPWTTDFPGRKWRFPYEPIRLLLGGNWKAKQLWRLLDARRSRPEYEEAPCGGDSRLGGRRAVIVGAGPCGLRAAIELRLLGAQVAVVERREQFSRINQLHLWDWCGEELKQLGARVLEPPPGDFGADPDLLHISINNLQTLLLKVALLLGVEVLLGVDYVATDWSPTGVRQTPGWVVSLRPGSELSAAEGRAGAEGEASQAPTAPSPRAPRALHGVSVLMGASGFGCGIGREAGMSEKMADHLRKESAIGLICNFSRRRGPSEAKLRSFSMARQFYSRLFQQAARATGADLENIVYTKGHRSHCFVMTPTRECLVASGVVISRSHQPLLARENIDFAKLDAFVRKVISFPFVEGQQAVHAALAADSGNTSPCYADTGPRLFDFSQMKRSADGLSFVRPPLAQSSSGSDDELLVALVGDALVEPFWPEGLGIIRGFFGVLDACFAVSQWAVGQSTTSVLAGFDESYVRLKTINAATRSCVLHNDERRFALAPYTRYRDSAGRAGGASRSAGSGDAGDPPMVARALALYAQAA